MKRYELPESVLVEVLTYLQQLPYAQVAALIAKVQTNAVEVKVEEEKPKEQ